MSFTSTATLRRSKLFLFFFLLLLFGAACAVSSRAQFLDQGGVTGVVQDPGGAVIPGADVVLTNVETSLKLTTKTDQSGVYIFSPVKIGHYSVTVTASGFQQTTQQNIPSISASGRMSPMRLQPGGVNQSITVTGAPPLLQTQESSTGQTFTSQQVNDTPLNGRNIIYLAQLAPGAVPSPGSRARGNGDFDAKGMRAEQNNYVLDGVDNKLSQWITWGRQLSHQPAAGRTGRVQSLHIELTAAEFGHSAGAVVNASIKSRNQPDSRRLLGILSQRLLWMRMTG